MSLGGKYAFATVMSLVLPMCILISCSSMLCVLMGMFMFVKVISVISPPPSLFVPSVCAYAGVMWYFRCFSFLYEICFLYCDDARLGAVY